MELTELLGRIPAGYGVEVVDRKVIDPKTATVVQRTSIDLVHDGRTPLRFSTVDDVSAALDLVAAAGKQRRGRLSVVPPPAALPLASTEEAEPADEIEPEAETTEPHDDDDDGGGEQQHEAPPPPPRQVAPGGPVQSQFMARQASRKANDKTPLPPVGTPASV